MPGAQNRNGIRAVVRNPAALSHWRRKRSMEARIDEVRAWFLRCASCEHTGCVNMTLRQLRASNLKCSKCSTYLWRNTAVE